MVSSRALAFTDPHLYQAAARAADVEILLTTKGDFHAELTQIDLPRLWMMRRRETLPRVFHSTIGPKRAPIVFLGDTEQQAIHHTGMEVSPGDIIVDGLGATHHHRSWGPCSWAAMSLTPDDLAATAHALTGRDLGVPAVTHLVRPAPALMSQLLGLHASAIQLAESAPATLARPEVARALEHSLVHVMIRCLTEHDWFEMDSAGCRHLAVIARFEDLLGANENRAVHLAEICAATGVSERTLRVCCHDHLGMGPVRYLWLRRMHLAHRALVVACPMSTTVTEIATSYGFWELGRFSVAYRALFGESPSASLRRPPDDRRRFQDSPFALRSAESA